MDIFLPATRQEMINRGWDTVDIVLVTGDAYIDHPSFGIALIGRWLESHGFRVAILAQPRYDRIDDFTRFGKPNLFFGISAGNLDSIVANYTGNAKVRDIDQYSENGNPYFSDKKEKTNRRRPDRATIRYANLAKQAYPETIIVLGGIEASLRRFVHFDYQQNKLRASVLGDAKADLLVYGMGENAILEIAKRIQNGSILNNIPGTCERLTEKELHERSRHDNFLVLPSFEEISKEKRFFMEAELAIDKHFRSLSKATMIQKQQSIWIMQNQPAAFLSTKELDTLYMLPFTRKPHPSYREKVPAYDMIKNSITIVRGCCGNCSFCAITRHQGPVIISRSIESIVKEAKEIALSPGFKGTITDLGGPTANLYGVSCGLKTCKKHDCLYPNVCRHLSINENLFDTLLNEISSIKPIKKIFISSGMRMELLLNTPQLLERIICNHIPGVMKIAPEHCCEEVLRLMHKESREILPKFLKTCRGLAQSNGKQILFTPYFISSHPGCSENDMKQLAKNVSRLDLKVKQFQDFTPTPGTLSTAMYVSGLDRDKLEPIYVARNYKARLKQRTVLEDALQLKPKSKQIIKMKKSTKRKYS